MFKTHGFFMQKSPFGLGYVFQGGIQGMWYAPLLGTMFQDTSGTVLVENYGDRIALQLDLSGNGNHRYQSVDADRTIYGRWPLSAVQQGFVRNLLVNTATLSTQAVTTTAAEHTLSFKGTGTITLTGTSTAGPLIGTGADEFVSLTFTPTAGTLTLTVSGTVESAQLELGSIRTIAQIVGASRSWDVSEAGQPDVPFVFWNGVNYWMETDSINMSNNEMDVFVALTRRKAEGENGRYLESETTITDGRISIATPTTVITNGLTTLFRGTSSNFIRESVVQINSTKIISASAKISTPIHTQWADGIQTGINSSASMGSGSFRNIKRYFGREGTTSSSYFQGNDYGFVMVNKNQSEANRQRIEQYLAARSKGAL
jgi:hypothetical protein